MPEGRLINWMHHKCPDVPEIPVLSVIGLGKLGAPLAACLAAREYSVVGVDIDANKVREINHGESPVCEPQMEEVLKDAGNNLVATVHLESAVKGSDVTFIVVPTPSRVEGSFSLYYVLIACDEIGKALKDKHGYHLIVLVSTVNPTDCEKYVIPKLEASSGKKCGVDFGFCYGPEFVALGNAVKGFLNPDFVLIGQYDELSGDILARLNKDWHVIRTNVVNAEIAKLALNVYLVTKISYANVLAHLCEKVEGADVDEVTKALGADSRIGKQFLTGGLGASGPCLPRDCNALNAFLVNHGVGIGITNAVTRFNQGEQYRIAQMVRENCPINGTVGILGIAYKPDTDVTDESTGLFLAKNLKRDFHTISFDPLVRDEQVSDIKWAAVMEDCVKASDVVVITTRATMFYATEYMYRNQTVIDCWRILKEDKMDKSVKYIPIGRFRE